MSETEFVLFQNIIGGIETFLYAVCLTAFFYPFMTEKKERQGSKLKKILIVFGSYIAISLMEEVEQFYNGIRQMKHEMRNHLTNIKGLMESGNYEDMQQYLSKMDESMNVFEITIQTGNAVTDVIVNDKQKAASKQGVQFQSEFSYPVSDRYDAYDIGIIVNNLLQNALEACEKMNTGERYITLSGKQKRKFFLIEVRNSFDGEIKFDSNTNLPVSDKEKDISFQDETNAEEIDILFLDISMGDEDGMTVAKQLRSQMESKKEAVWGSLPLLIFVTGYPEYMQEAFSVNAFQYIVKPIQESNFEQVFAQTIREYQYLMAKKKEKPKEVLVRNGNRTRSVSADDIYYIESSNRKVTLYLRHEKIEYYDKISSLESELKPDFFRIHKGYLVNIKYVERYDRTEVKMRNGDSLLISKYKYQDFVKCYLEYILEER